MGLRPTTSGPTLLAAGLLLVGAVALAHAGGGAPMCLEQMWTSTKQYEDLGGKRCSSYSNCPKGISCYAGRIHLRVARTETMSVYCVKYKGGRWDQSKGVCVGGTIAEDPPMSDTIRVEVCMDGCN